MKRLAMSMKSLSLMLMFLVVGGCAALRSDLSEPDVAVTALRMGQSEGFSQTVLIDLTISNPNTTALKFNAISYRVRIEGRDVISGGSSEPLEIAAGGAKTYTVPATVNLMSGLGLIRELISKPKNKVAYELNATLEPSGLFSIPMHLKKIDSISLQ